jgi:hypothetical protein
MAKPNSNAVEYNRAINSLQSPNSRLVLQHSRNPVNRGFFILPGGTYVDKATAQDIIKRCDPVDAGLIPGSPQSWRLRR